METFIHFVDSLPAWLTGLGIALISAIPFVESYFGSAIGVVVGLHPAVAVILAALGNIVSMLAVVFAASAARSKVLAARGQAGGEPIEISPKRARAKRMFDRWGVAGVSLLGQAVLPSQITSGMMVSLGASRNKVIGWQLIAIVLWGVLFAALVVVGFNLFG